MVEVAVVAVIWVARKDGDDVDDPYAVRKSLVAPGRDMLMIV